jgi:hypothetical protein
MIAIVADHYREEDAALAGDVHVQTMAADVANGIANARITLASIAHDDGSPRHEFMLNCLDEYRRRVSNSDGVDNHHSIGGVAKVVLKMALGYVEVWKSAGIDAPGLK